MLLLSIESWLGVTRYPSSTKMAGNNDGYAIPFVFPSDAALCENIIKLIDAALYKNLMWPFPN